MSTKGKLIGELAALRVGPDEVLIITFNPQGDQDAATIDSLTEMLTEALEYVGLAGRSLVLAGGDISLTVATKDPPPPEPALRDDESIPVTDSP